MFKTPAKKVMASLKKHLIQLKSSKDEEHLKAKTKLSADILQIHFYLYGDADNPPRTDLINTIVDRMLNTEDNLFTKLAQNIEFFDFEAKKHTSGIMSYIIRRCSKNNVHLYIKQQTNDITHTNIIIDCLLKGYHDQHLAPNVGSVLQEMAKRSEIAPHLLLEIQVTPNIHSLAIAQQKNVNHSKTVKKNINANTNSNINSNINSKINQIEDIKTDEFIPSWDILDELFILVKKPSFDISSDAYKTLHLLLTRHKKIVIRWLTRNYDLFVLTFDELIQSKNYVTQRQFLKLLSDVLMEKSNFSIMIKYIGAKENLKTAMILIKNDSKVISHEAFHIFKIFVANPKKTRDIQIILYKNKEKLVLFLQSFLMEKTAEDELFANEKQLCIQNLEKMPIPPEIEIHLAKKRDRAKSKAEAEAALKAQTPPPTALNIANMKKKSKNREIEDGNGNQKGNEVSQMASSANNNSNMNGNVDEVNDDGNASKEEIPSNDVVIQKDDSNQQTEKSINVDIVEEDAVDIQSNA